MENHVRRGFTVCTVREFGSRNFLCDDDVIRLYIVESFIYTKSILHSFHISDGSRFPIFQASTLGINGFLLKIFLPNMLKNRFLGHEMKINLSQSQPDLSIILGISRSLIFESPSLLSLFCSFCVKASKWRKSKKTFS